MTTATWSTKVRHDSDATYQAWRDEFITKLGLLSTYLTADEETITPGAGARAGANTEAEYAVYHLNDSLHATYPIYIRFGFGTGTATDRPRVQITTGTTTNGSGVLGGTCLSTIASIHSSAAQTTDTARNSYFCAHNGFFGLNWKVGAGATEAFFALCRTVDSTGAISSTGYSAAWGSGASTAMTKTQCFRMIATAAAYTLKTVAVDTLWGFIPQAPSATLVGADTQAAVAWCITPAVAPLIGICGVMDNEVAGGSSFTATLVGSSARTYLALTILCGPFAPVAPTATAYLKYAMLWE